MSDEEYPKIRVTALLDLLLDCVEEQDYITMDELQQAWDGLVES